MCQLALLAISVLDLLSFWTKEYLKCCLVRSFAYHGFWWLDLVGTAAAAARLFFYIFYFTVSCRRLVLSTLGIVWRILRLAVSLSKPSTHLSTFRVEFLNTSWSALSGLEVISTMYYQKKDADSQSFSFAFAATSSRWVRVGMWSVVKSHECIPFLSCMILS